MVLFNINLRQIDLRLPYRQKKIFKFCSSSYPSPLNLPSVIDGINRVFKDKSTYVFYETPTSPILTQNKNYQVSESVAERNVPKHKRSRAKPNKTPRILPLIGWY